MNNSQTSASTTSTSANSSINGQNLFPADLLAIAGGGNFTMTSESWMQVATRAAQLASQLREMENMGLAGTSAVAGPLSRPAQSSLAQPAGDALARPPPHGAGR